MKERVGEWTFPEYKLFNISAMNFKNLFYSSSSSLQSGYFSFSMKNIKFMHAVSTKCSMCC